MLAMHYWGDSIFWFSPLILLGVWLLSLFAFGISFGAYLYGFELRDQNGAALDFPEDIGAVLRGLFPTSKEQFHPRAHWVLKSKKHSSLIAPFALLILSALASVSTYWTLSSRAVLQALPVRTLPLYLPPDERNWNVLAFYYSVGGWPRTFRGRPVFYSLPYKKGPPYQFAAEIIARLLVPKIKLSIEGPQTPEGAPTPDIIKDCLTRSFKISNQAECLSIRSTSLARHLEALDSVHPKTRELVWFEVDNPALLPEERPRGVLLKAHGATRTQERYVLITPKGAHQTLILNRPSGEADADASLLVEQMIRSMRVLPDLLMGKVIAHDALQKIQLSPSFDLRNLVQYGQTIADAQALLISKISLEPGDLQAYLHLGGTAHLLLSHVSNLRAQSTTIIGGEKAELIDQWTAAQFPLIESAYAYARDIDPDNPTTTRLNQLRIDAAKRKSGVTD